MFARKTVGRQLRKCVQVETRRSCVREVKDGREIDRERERERERDVKQIDDRNRKVTESNIR